MSFSVVRSGKRKAIQLKEIAKKEQSTSPLDASQEKTIIRIVENETKSRIIVQKNPLKVDNFPVNSQKLIGAFGKLVSSTSNL